MTVRYPGRVPLDRRRRPGAAGDAERARCSAARVTVQDALWSQPHRDDPRPLQPRRAAQTATLGVGRRRADAVPLRFDIDIVAPSSLRIENNIANMVASADLRLQGTYDRPLLFGRAEIDRGDIAVRRQPLHRHAGRQHRLLQPVADRAVLRHRGRDARPRARTDLPSDASASAARPAGSAPRSTPIRRCPKSTSSRCCFGQNVDLDDAELRALRSNAAQQSEEALLRRGHGSRLLASPISRPVGRALGRGARHRHRADRAVARQRNRPADAVGARRHRQAHLESRLPDVRAGARRERQRSAIRSSSSSTTRTTGSGGSSRRTATTRSRSTSACGTGSDDLRDSPTVRRLVFCVLVRTVGVLPASGTDPPRASTAGRPSRRCGCSSRTTRRRRPRSSI